MHTLQRLPEQSTIQSIRALVQRYDVRISTIYSVVAFLWILASDSFLSLLVTEHQTLLIRSNLLKGLVFVGFTTLALFAVISAEIQKRRCVEEAMQEHIAERIRAETALKESEAKYRAITAEKELIELKERFTSMVSHEFRGPLSAIILGCELLEEYGDHLPSEKSLTKVRQIHTAAQRMVDMMEDVLTLSRDRAGELHLTVLNLEDLCRDVLAALQPQNTAGCTLSLNAVGQLNNIHADEKLLRHILTNLLSNAIKYSPNGGNVSLDLSREQQAVVFCIRDEGIGIPAADQQRLFEPFHRAKNVRGISGTGLGLAIVKECVDKYRGTIVVESVEGKGTTFTVRLPIL